MTRRPILFALSFAIALPVCDQTPAASLVWNNAAQIETGFHQVIGGCWTKWIMYLHATKEEREQRVLTLEQERARTSSERVRERVNQIIDFFEHMEKVLAGANKKDTFVFGHTMMGISDTVEGGRFGSVVKVSEARVRTMAKYNTSSRISGMAYSRAKRHTIFA